ncbi:MAG: hypothetical protein J0I84_05385, partial [Terrimonas sp.]|nr:hypothetical protein [Terrimonas sp.]
MATIYNEALSRNYNFDKEKIDWNFKPSIMCVTTGQIKFETEHLLNKLKIRDKKKFDNLNKLK